MSAMPIIRCSRSIGYVTRRTHRSSIGRVRFQSTEAAPNTNDSSSSISAEGISGSGLKRQLHTLEPSKRVEKEKTGGSKGTTLDLHRLNIDRKSLYGHGGVFDNTINGPIGVRKEIGQQDQENANIVVENSKIIVGDKTIPNIWLRDNCQCGSCMHESTKQRLQDTFAIPRDLAIKSATLTEAQGVRKRDLQIEWSDGHRSNYSQPFLEKATRGYDQRSVVRQGLVDIHLWDSSIASDPPIKFFKDESVIGTMLDNIRKYGFCYIDNTPFDTPAATEALLRRIAFIRETHYGGFYDFTADLASKDTAYTNIALEAHTDNTYFSDPAGLQAFHLLSHTDGSGGASLLVDGFKVADELFHQDREAYKILSTVNVHAHASGNEGISIQPYRGFPVLEHDPSTGDLLRVRWNSSDRASIELPIHEVEMWYDAARKFDALLKKKENEYWEQLKPGRVLVFDNWRVLHGRSKFTGKRRICGGYINRDDWMSRFKIHRFGQDKVMGSLASS